MVDRYATKMGGRASVGTHNNSCACGCNCNSNTNECKKLKKRLQVVEFALIDAVLYLDAYPCSSEALAYYHKLRQERQEILEAMAHCNTPITIFDNTSERSWDWTNAPWPWELEAN